MTIRERIERELAEAGEELEGVQFVLGASANDVNASWLVTRATTRRACLPATPR